MKLLHKRLSYLSTVLFLIIVSPSCSRLGRHFANEDEGGSFVVIAVKAESSQLDQSVAQTIAVLEKRCDGLGIRCKAERLAGDKSNQIKISYPAIKDPERIKSVLLAKGGLEFRAVVSPPMPAPLQSYSTKEEASAAAGTDKDVLPYLDRSESEMPASGRFVIVEHTPIATGQDIRDAESVNQRGAQNEYAIFFRLTPDGGQRFGNWTAANINNYLAVVLNGKVVSVAFIKSQITDSGEINGRYTKESAEDLALVLRSGNFTAPIEAVEEGIYKP